ncbi:hypothetical protein Tco_0531220 [Tanacetum coccineum]
MLLASQDIISLVTMLLGAKIANMKIQQAAREEVWVSRADKVKISSTNIRIDPTMTQKEETYQVVLDIIKNTTFYKAFTAIANVQEIFMQKFWHKVTKIDNRQLKKGRREIIPYPIFTKIIINHFLSIYKSIPKGLSSGLNTIKDDGIFNRMKFVINGEDAQEYGRAILEAMQVTRSHHKEAALDDNIITNNLEAALELGKSISKTDAKIVDETRRAHEMHARLVTKKIASKEASKESGGEPTNRPTGIDVMTDEERFAAETKKALKASRQARREATRTLRQFRGSNEGTGITPGFLIIMPPRMMTRSIGQPAAESQGGGMGGRAGRDGGRVTEPRRRNVNPTVEH